MSEEEYQILWNKAMQSYKASDNSRRLKSNNNSGTTMLQYQRGASWHATGAPVNFDKKISNFGMEPNYKNGVVTITDPGIYLIQSTLYNGGSKTMSHRLIKDHQITVVELWNKSWLTSELTHIMYLDFLDTINIRLASGGPHSDANKGYFSVIKLD